MNNKRKNQQISVKKIMKTIALLVVLGIGLHVLRQMMPGIDIPENVKNLIFVLPILMIIIGLAKILGSD